jgi:hypothetical protein
MNDIVVPDLDGIISSRGTPVSNGKVKARVCVAPKLEDAVNIKVSFNPLCVEKIRLFLILIFNLKSRATY